MKIAPIVRALENHKDEVAYRIVHTGQHYDRAMSAVFFDELGIPQPDYHLACGGGSHAEQTAKIMIAYEKLCHENRPHMVLVVGDVNSTLACSIVAKKLHRPVAHVEAGLRSGDRHMPEEINRLVTDAVSDLFFVTEPSGVANLLREGQPQAAIHHVGHVMVDNLLFQKARLEKLGPGKGHSCGIKARRPRYGAVTLHRPSNVDDPVALARIAGALDQISRSLPLIFPVHPRTRQQLDKAGIAFSSEVEMIEPMGYMDFLNLWKDASVVVTDSGGLQEETTALGIPCVTVRDNTERPITIEEGTNILAGVQPQMIIDLALSAAAGEGKTGRRPALWDGHASERIVGVLLEFLAHPTS